MDSSIKVKIKNRDDATASKKKYYFLGLPMNTNQNFSFSSSLENIGFRWDVDIKNYTHIMPLSCPITIKREVYNGGKEFRVIKIMDLSNKNILYVREEQVVEFDDMWFN